MFCFFFILTFTGKRGYCIVSDLSKSCNVFLPKPTSESHFDRCFPASRRRSPYFVLPMWAWFPTIGSYRFIAHRNPPSIPYRYVSASLSSAYSHHLPPFVPSNMALFNVSDSCLYRFPLSLFLFNAISPTQRYSNLSSLRFYVPICLCFQILS